MSLRLCSALAAIVFALVFSANASTARGQHKHAAGKRYEWNVTEPDVHISGNTAWIAYVNKGSITDAFRHHEPAMVRIGLFAETGRHLEDRFHAQHPRASRES